MTTTLESPPVSTLLERLFAEADADAARARELVAAVSPEERARIFADQRLLYGKARDLHLAVSRSTAQLLYVLGRATRARSVVEFGTSFGLSTIHLAAAVRDNGGGRVVGSELEPTKAARARANLAAAGLGDLVEIREGDALDTLARDLPETIDLVLLDGHKPLYDAILERLEPRLRPGACVVADNADDCPAYVARVRAPGGGFASVPFAGDVEVTTRV